MQTLPERHPPHFSFRIPAWLVLCVFAAIGVVLLWTEHRAHMLGAGLWGLLLVCPLMHVLMHGGHGSHGARGDGHGVHGDGTHTREGP